LVRIVSRRFGRRSVGSHTTENVADRQQNVSNRVVLFDHHKTQGKHRETPHKTPHHQAYTRANVPLWHPSAIRQHFSE
jgi:hypothetical protein